MDHTTNAVQLGFAGMMFLAVTTGLLFIKGRIAQIFRLKILVLAVIANALCTIELNKLAGLPNLVMLPVAFLLANMLTLGFLIGFGSLKHK